jgi:alpha-glucosidase
MRNEAIGKRAGPVIARAVAGLLFFTTISVCVTAQTVPPTITSPDRRLEIQFSTIRDNQPTTASGALVYSVKYTGKPLVNDSGLSLDLEGQPPLGADVHLAETTPSSGVDDYSMIAGKTSHVHDAYNSATLTLTEPNAPARSMTVEARAYNGAVAFRYVIPQQPALSSYRLKQEHTEFSIGKDAPSWALYLPNFQSAYESEYIHLNVSAFNDQGGVPNHALIGLPLLTHVPGVAWMAIMEAGLEGDAKMYLTNPSDRAKAGSRTRLESVLSPRLDNSGLAIIGALPHQSAWHVLLVGEEPGRLIESNVIEDLNRPVAIKDTSWIHAGKSSWNWWSGDIGPDDKPDGATARPGFSPMTTDKMKYYVDFAAQSGFPYALVDAGWSLQTNAPRVQGGGSSDITQMNGRVDIPELVKYGAPKGVKIWIWIHYKPASEQMDTAFPLYEKWGVAGVKIDFIQRDDQQGIEFYYKAAQVAAEHHLQVDFHGATPPWGLDRTYPNVLGYEAIMGMEYSKWSGRDNPIHRTTLPFTRLLAGPMDYTPGGFRNATLDKFVARGRFPMVLGTRAQQLALYVVDYVPFQMVSDAPSAYANQPAFQFIKDVPAAWDDTRVLNGFPAKYVTVARRKGRDWYLGSITNWDARDVNVPLNFLGDGQYTAEIYQDASDANENAEHVSAEKKTLRQNDRLTLHLASGGGCAIRFVRK